MSDPALPAEQALRDTSAVAARTLTGERRPVLICAAGTARVVVSSLDVREVCPATVVVPLPGAHPICPGVVMLRGRVVPLIDLASIVDGWLVSASDVTPRLVVLASDAGEFAIQVGQTHGLDELDPQLFRDGDGDVILGVRHTADAPWVWIDPAALARRVMALAAPAVKPA